MAEKSDYLIAAFSLLCQIGVTVLLFKHGEWGKALSPSIQREIIAAISVLYLSILYLILNLRSERGNTVSEVGKLIAYYFSLAIVLLIIAGISEYTIHRLWLSFLVPLAIFSLADLIRISELCDHLTPITVPLMNALVRTEGHMWLKIAVFHFMIVFRWVLLNRERRWVTAREEVEKLEIRNRREVEAKKE